jgi:succinyl-diaminopimelate desuccinylase
MTGPDVVDRAARLVAAPTSGGGEGAAVALAADILDRAGSTVRRVPLAAVGAGRGVPAATFFIDAGVLARPRMDVVICGPGSPEPAHVVDEHCEVARIVAAVDLFEHAAVRRPAGATEDDR